jgi:hypothetical protein
MRQGDRGYTSSATDAAMMSTMGAGRALLRALWRRRPNDGASVPPKPWGRIGDYEAVTRHGMLLLLSPEHGHPSRRATDCG